jgi:hypothetical protein
MAINKSKLKCVHCLTIPDVITDDHVIPESWYSQEKSKQSVKPTAPSCEGCNNSLGDKEKLLSHFLWIALPESSPLRNELVAKAYRACGMSPDGKPLLGLSETEKRARQAHAKKLLSFARPQGTFNEKRILSGFGFHDGYPKERQQAMVIPGEFIGDVLIKIVRGLEYTRGSKRYVEPPYEVFIKLNVSGRSDLQVLRDTLEVFQDGTNSIQRGFISTEPLEPIYIVKLWNRWEIWATIGKKAVSA